MVIIRIATIIKMNISMSMSSIQLERKLMKTINLTDDQFETLFHFVDERVEDIVDRSVQFQDSEILEDWEDLFDVHTVLESVASKV